MKIIISTESGTTYTMDTILMSYVRTSDNPLRDPDSYAHLFISSGKGGRLLYVPDIKVGESMVINHWPASAGILTTAVVSISIEGDMK